MQAGIAKTCDRIEFPAGRASIELYRVRSPVIKRIVEIHIHRGHPGEGECHPEVRVQTDVTAFLGGGRWNRCDKRGELHILIVDGEQAIVDRWKVARGYRQ